MKINFNNRVIILQTKKKKSKARKKKKAAQSVPQLSVEQLDGMWEDDVAPSLSALLQGREEIPSDITPPFDPTSDRPDDEQR